MNTLINLLDAALAARGAFFDERHESAFRLFNGFLEGFPALSVDIYAHSVLLHNYADPPADDLTADAQRWVLEKFPWARCVIVKTRSGQSDSERRGLLTYGTASERKVKEHGIWYSIDLTMNRDASFYLDTRSLREWALKTLGGKTVLNTFAYTGSLGVAAKAGGAARVVQLDQNRDFLNVAKTSYTLNGLPIDKQDFIAENFFPTVSQFKRSRQTFDCVFLDPPFFSFTSKGTVDLETGSSKLINNGGWLVAINNALFVSGKEYLASLEALCADGYLSLEQFIPVPEDCAGFPQTRVGDPPVDPAPFNHSTKIAILRIRRKLQADQL